MKNCINGPASKQTDGVSIASIGLDVSDRQTTCVAIGGAGEIIDRRKISTRAVQIDEWAATLKPTTMALEAGPHSPWMSRLLIRHGHEVIVANAAKVPSIGRSRSKSDWRDAEQLARLARFDRSMLHPIEHRGETTQRDLQVIRSRDVLVRARTKLIGHVRSTGKAYGYFIPYCSSDAFTRRARGSLPQNLQELIAGVMECIERLSKTIRWYDRQIEQLVASRYRAAKWLTQIQGVGSLTALTFVLVLADASRFRSSRMVGPYLGLTPARHQSGESDPQKRISKEGDTLLRRLLVHSAHYILGPFGSDSDLRRHGERISARGGKNGKKRAAVAVARKLAVLMHRLWTTHQIYDPLFASKRNPVAA
jgi:transposase